MANYSQSGFPSGRSGRPRTNACEVCRSAKVKCDQRHPICLRCSRLNLQCSWLSKRAELTTARRSAEKQRKLLPKSDASQMPINVTSPNVSSQVERDLDMSWSTSCLDFSSLLYWPTLFMHDVVLDHSLVLSGDEYQALHHYQERFISDRLLTTPRWSMLGCILQSVFHIPVAMHFLIAISSMDLNRRSPRPAVSVSTSRAHFRKGSDMLIQLMNLDTEPHHFSTLSSFFFLYLCMSHRDRLDKKAIEQLSLAVLNYIQRFTLDRLSSGVKLEENSFTSAWHDPCRSTEPGLIGRLLLFVASEDIKMEFEGCGGHLAKHLFGSDDLHWRIFSQQRYILERHWGQSYPDNEVMHHLETTAVMEMGHRITCLFHKVNELSKKVSDQARPRDPEIDRGIIEIETQYSSILRMTQLPKAARSPFLRTSDTAVSGFYFVQLYYFRLTLSDYTQESPPHIMFAMTSLMNIAHRAFGEQDPWGHELFQLPLFMTGIETKDRIHVEWIISKMSRLRFRTALSEIISIQDRMGRRLSMARVKQILEDLAR